MPRMPPVHTRFKKGQSGNPSGKPKNLLTRDRVNAVIGRLVSLNVAELEKIANSKTAPMLDVTVASILAKAADTGDYSRLDFLLQRTIGKVKDELEVSTPKPYIIQRQDGTQLELGARKPNELAGGLPDHQDRETNERYPDED